MQYRLLLKEVVAILQLRLGRLIAAFGVGVLVGILIFSAPRDVSSTLRDEPIQVENAIARAVTTDTAGATLAELERQEELLIRAWNEQNRPSALRN